MATGRFRMRAMEELDLTQEDVDILKGIKDLAARFPGVLSAIPDLEELAMLVEEFLRATPDPETVGGGFGLRKTLAGMHTEIGSLRSAADQATRAARHLGEMAEEILSADKHAKDR